MDFVDDDEEPEEGEIVEDDLEDISDGSIVEQPSYKAGKLVSTKDRLRALSLSSISGNDDNNGDDKNMISGRERGRRGGPQQRRRRSVGAAAATTLLLQCKHRKKIKFKICGEQRKNNQYSKRITTTTSRSPVGVINLAGSSGTAESSDDDEADKVIQEQLNQAVHIRGVEKLHRNSLRSRLKGMVIGSGISAATDDDDDVISKWKTSSIISDKSNDDDDDDLEELRLEALKTAVLNKFRRRKKRKAQEMMQNNNNNVLIKPQSSSSSCQTLLLENNKENEQEQSIIDTHNNNIKDGLVVVMEESNAKRPCIEQNGNDLIVDNNNSRIIQSDQFLDEDEDVLRASLLAAISKKITKRQITEKGLIVEKLSTSTAAVIAPESVVTATTITPSPPPPPLPLKPISRIVNNINRLPSSVVKPLIINVNNDSDSDDERLVLEKSSKNDVAPMISSSSVDAASTLMISSTVDQFLKEQRAQFENNAKKKTRIIDLDKSAVKLLPKSQQLEYQQLLMKLKNAEKRKKIRQKVTPIRKDTTATTMGSLLLLNNNNNNNNVTSLTPRKDKINTDHIALQNTLKDIQLFHNGSLQIKSKYMSLSPIMKKINGARCETRKQEVHIKRLLQELSEARSKLSRSQQEYSGLVKILVNKKNVIDKRLPANTSSNSVGMVLNGIAKKANNTIQPVVISTTPTTTPLIEDNNEQTLDTTFTTSTTTTTGSTTSTTTTTKLLNNVQIIRMEKTPITTSTTTIIPVDIKEDSSVVGKSSSTSSNTTGSTSSTTSDNVKKKLIIDNSLKYISPLDKSERKKDVNPLGIMCPYEVNGTCRDVDCNFTHFLKKNNNNNNNDASIIIIE